jgi:hypothetical protein
MLGTRPDATLVPPLHKGGQLEQARETHLAYLDAAKTIDGPGVGKDGFGVAGRFGGYPA